MNRFITILAMCLMLVACKKGGEPTPGPGPGPDPGPTPTPTPVGERCMATDYATVTIGAQVWMAENYKCSVYATESEAFQMGLKVIPNSESEVYTPYFTDPSNKTNWSPSSQQYGIELSSAQVEKLGYHYSWASAAGLSNGTTQSEPFAGHRQGICPNGWHLPTSDEIDNLVGYIEKSLSKGVGTAGRYLKSEKGWYDMDAQYRPGLDTYEFCALPAGESSGSKVLSVGSKSSYWTSTTNTLGAEIADVRSFFYNLDNVISTFSPKYSAFAVRCVKN